MGLETSSNNDNAGTFLTVRMGVDDKGRKKAVLAKRCTADTPGARQVFKANGDPAQNKDGENVYRLEYTAVKGRIVGMENVVSEFNGKSVKYLNIRIEDGAEHFILVLERGDRYWSDFMMRLPMINIDEPVRMAPYAIEEDGKFNQGISMQQHGEKVLRKWTKENGYEGGPPMAEQKEINDEVKWDFGNRNKWLEANVLEPAMAKLEASIPQGPKPTAEAKVAPQQGAHIAGDDEADLPF